MSPVTPASSPIPDTSPVETVVSSSTVQHAIMAGMLSGDLEAAAALGSLRNDAQLINKLIATFPPYLGSNLDAGA